VPKTRPPYPPEFRREAVRMLRSGVRIADPAVPLRTNRRTGIDDEVACVAVGGDHAATRCSVQPADQAAVYRLVAEAVADDDDGVSLAQRLVEAVVLVGVDGAVVGQRLRG